MTHRIQGAKYDENLDVAEIAKRIRKDVAEAMKSGRLPKMKVAVRISRYSMGQSIDVTLARAPQPIFNPERLRHDRDNRHAYVDGRALPIFNKYGRDILDHVESLVEAYNYNNSDSASDYHDYNFGGDVRFDCSWESARRVAETNWLDLADAPAEPDAAPARDTIPAPAMAANDTMAPEAPTEKRRIVIRAEACPCE